MDFLSLRCLSTATTDIHPPLRLSLYHTHLLVDQLWYRPSRRVFPQYFISNLKQKFVDVQLDRTRSYASLHNLRWEVVGAVEGYQYAVVDLLVDGFEAIVV